jgi:hypothetical protein
VKASVILEKILSAATAAGLVVSFDWRTVILVMIVLGQGHFLIAYLYQARAGKIDRHYAVNYLCWAAFIVGCYTANPFPAGLTVIATIYFAVHMAVDEVYLTRLPLQLGNSPMHLGRLLEILPVIALYAATVSDGMLARGAWPGFPPLLPASLLLSALVAVLYLALVVTRLYRPDTRSLYFLGAGTTLFAFAQQGWLQSLPTPLFSSFLILFHYFNWYLHYYLSLPPEQGPAYLARVLLINLLVVALYLGFGDRGPGWILFQEQNFYLWTLLHLISSTRLADFQGALRLPPPDSAGGST